MTPAIFGLAGEFLTPMERDFFRESQPFGFILFGRNVVDRAQLRALTDELKSAIVQHRSELLTLLRRPNGAYCCSACERFAFPTPTTCFWCRKKGRADA